METRGSQEQPAAPIIPWKVDSAESLVAKLGAEITELESQLSENQERLRGRRVYGISKFPRISKGFSKHFQRVLILFNYRFKHHIYVLLISPGNISNYSD